MGNIPSSASKLFSGSSSNRQESTTASGSDVDVFTKISNLKTPNRQRSLERLSDEVNNIISSTTPQQRPALAGPLSDKFESMALENYSKGRNDVADQLTAASLQLFSFQSGNRVHIVE